MSNETRTRLLVLNQMAGPLTWELVEDLARVLPRVGLLTGHPDTLARDGDDGVQLQAAVPYRRGGFASRILSWFRYTGQALRWVLRHPRTTPLLIFTNPPILPWLGWLLHRLRGQPYALMVHDIYPDLLIRLGHLAERHPVTRIWRGLNRRAFRTAAVVMTLGECMAESLARHLDGIDARDIGVIYPWADTENIRPVPKELNRFARQHGQLGKLTVMYSGNMGMGHDIETMLSAARMLSEDQRIHFMFIGAGPKWQLAQEIIAQHGLTNTTLLPWQPEDVIPYSLATADVALVSLEEEVAGLAIPSKAFYSLAAGSALVLTGGTDTTLARIIRRNECGWVLQPGQARELVSTLEAVASDPETLATKKRNARATAVRIGSRSNGKTIVDTLRRAFFSAESDPTTSPDIHTEPASQRAGHAN